MTLQRKTKYCATTQKVIKGENGKIDRGISSYISMVVKLE